jgi:hypothetical protein
MVCSTVSFLKQCSFLASGCSRGRGESRNGGGTMSGMAVERAEDKGDASETVFTGETQPEGRAWAGDPGDGMEKMTSIYGKG